MSSQAPQDLSVRCKPLGAERYLFHMDGLLAPGWAGNLAAGLAASRFSIERGAARAERGGVWTARFEVQRLPGAVAADSLDLAALAASDGGQEVATPLRLRDFSLEWSAQRGCLRLVVSAEDTVGFLAALLRRLAYFALFPLELRLETRGGRVDDELWLRGAGDRAPSPRARDALRSALELHAAQHD